MSLTTFRENLHPIAQQTVVLMKTSSVFVFRRHLDQGQYIRLGLTSSRRLQDVLQRRLSRHLQNVFKHVLQKYLQHIFKVSSRCFQDVFKTSSRHLQDILRRCLQDVLKTYHQVKLLLLTRFQDVFETYSKHF